MMVPVRMLLNWPERAVARYLVLAQVRTGELCCAAFGGDFGRSIIGTLLLRQAVDTNLPDRPLSAHAIAEALGIPSETTRRQVAAMINEGMLTRAAEGVALSAAARASPVLAQLKAQVIANISALLGHLAAIGVDLPTGAAMDGSGPALLTTALDINLVCMEAYNPLHRNLLEMRVMGAVTVENCYAFTADRSVSLHYGSWDRSPPESMKRPVTTRRVAELLGEPYATVWRSVQRLQAKGVLATFPGGLVTMNAPIDAQQGGARDRSVAYLRRCLQRLAADGWDLAGIARADLVARGRLGRDFHGDPMLHLPPRGAVAAREAEPVRPRSPSSSRG